MEFKFKGPKIEHKRIPSLTKVLYGTISKCNKIDIVKTIDNDKE